MQIKPMDPLMLDIPNAISDVVTLHPFVCNFNGPKISTAFSEAVCSILLKQVLSHSQ